MPRIVILTPGLAGDPKIWIALLNGFTVTGSFSSTQT